MKNFSTLDPRLVTLDPRPSTLDQKANSRNPSKNKVLKKQLPVKKLINWLDGKHGAGVPGYGARGTGSRGVENTAGVWKTRGVENTGSGWKTRGLVENTGSEWETRVFNEKTRGNYFFAKIGGIAFFYVNGSFRAIQASRGEINRENRAARGELFLR